MSPSRIERIHRGDVWLARLGPVVGAEMDKTRPVVIISADGVGSLPVKLAAPCTTSTLPPVAWRIPIKASASNGLDRDTTVDLMQTRSLSVDRLVHKLGVLDSEDMEDIAAMVAVIVDYR